MSALKSAAARLAAASALAIAMGSGVLATPAFAEAAPSCIERGTTISGVYKTFWAYNGCGTQYRILFRISWHVDSDCQTLFPEYTRSYTIINGTPAALQSVDLC